MMASACGAVKEVAAGAVPQHVANPEALKHEELRRRLADYAAPVPGQGE